MTEFAKRYGPVILVTGASSGIGKAFAEALAKRGLDLVLTARRLELLEEIARDLATAHGIRAVTVQADLTQPDAAEQIDAETSSLDIGLVISNAGFSMKGDHAGNDAASMTEMLMVNCHAPMQLTHAFIPRLRTRGRGGIILTSSVEGLIGCPFRGLFGDQGACEGFG